MFTCIAGWTPTYYWSWCYNLTDGRSLSRTDHIFFFTKSTGKTSNKYIKQFFLVFHAIIWSYYLKAEEICEMCKKEITNWNCYDLYSSHFVMLSCHLTCHLTLPTGLVLNVLLAPQIPHQTRISLSACQKIYALLDMSACKQHLKFFTQFG